MKALRALFVRLFGTFASSKSDRDMSAELDIDWDQQNQVFEHMAIYRGGRRTLTGSGDPSNHYPRLRRCRFR